MKKRPMVLELRFFLIKGAWLLGAGVWKARVSIPPRIFSADRAQNGGVKASRWKKSSTLENGGWEYCHRSRELVPACVRGGVHGLLGKGEPMGTENTLRDTGWSFSHSRTRSTRGLCHSPRAVPSNSLANLAIALSKLNAW